MKCGKIVDIIFDSSYLIILYKLKLDNHSEREVTKDFLQVINDVDVAQLPIMAKNYLEYYQFINKDNL